MSVWAAYADDSGLSVSMADAALIIIAVNKITELTQIIREMGEALEKIEDVNSAIDYPVRNTSYGDWELRRIAQETRQRIESRIG